MAIIKPMLLMTSLALALGACSSDNTPKNSTAQTNPTGITINNASEPETLDP
ncbi:hypothetical protein NGM44_02585 [Moraxella sp. FZFQ2102]|uniref:hypothetical protein n=1 Tax=Moraxella sp. FZFQ2102 TaxID=2953752 RepID=UPI00209C3E23|nr:hypothetical protein [Moraxella sp. FZFQ2102]USZ15299.1 hypothetical protein NGM44_02585 [Moraxella sp. FZFQ2102]